MIGGGMLRRAWGATAGLGRDIGEDYNAYRQAGAGRTMAGARIAKNVGMAASGGVQRGVQALGGLSRGEFAAMAGGGVGGAILAGEGDRGIGFVGGAMAGLGISKAAPALRRHSTYVKNAIKNSAIDSAAALDARNSWTRGATIGAVAGAVGTGIVGGAALHTNNKPIRGNMDARNLRGGHNTLRANAPYNRRAAAMQMYRDPQGRFAKYAHPVSQSISRGLNALNTQRLLPGGITG